MSSTAPACPAPGSISSPGLITPKVTVTSARTAGPSTAPVSASMPLGRSTATTVAPACLASSGLPRQAGERLPQPAPPADAEQAVDDQVSAVHQVGMSARIASTRIASTRIASRESPITRPPAARRAAVPPWCALGPAAIAVTATPRRASKAAA